MSRELSWNFRFWKRELASLFCGTLCFIALAALLYAFDGKTIFRWHGITLNALVSILSTAAKVLVLYSIAESTSQWKWLHFSEQKHFLIDFDKIDAASRGPLGSFKLLWRKNRELIVRIGAVTTVLALAVDPFTQQLGQYQQRQVPQKHGIADVPRADRYSRGRLFNTQLTMVLSDPPKVQAFADADFIMQSAVLYGLTQPSEMIAQQLPHTCTSGNCTWDAFESLSVCNVCNDLSDKVVKYRDYNFLFADLQTDNGIAIREMGTAFRLPNSLSIDGFDSWNYTTESTSLEVPGGIFMTTYGTGNGSETVSLQDIDTLIWAMTFLKIHPPQDGSNQTWPNLEIEARECGLYYCANRYNSTISSGTLSEDISEVTSAKRDPDSWQITSSKWAAVLNSSTVSSLNFDGKLSAAPRSDLSLGGKYNVSQAAVNSVSSYFSDFFSTNLNITHNVTETQQARLNGYIMSDGNLQYKPSSMQAFNMSNDLPATFASLAKSMSNSIRANDDGAKVQAGTVYETVTFYKIEWEWISLHCFFIIAATIFIVLTIYQTRLRGTPAWKSSSLAVLSRGLMVGHTFRGAETMSDLTARARSEKACLYGNYSEIQESREDVELEEIVMGPSDVQKIFKGARSIR
ncbi:uncharacterized protein EAF02_006037 [Botrytis sinoallii]|uniref:uncharacterized protein n=1 Tax=Botrytis sinoallii TaxID=1463999 RepID=UPI0018FF9311|nr:uncharacterized protein EAF02_006037 [Botrytis sinoallii]KAF7882674.1 hypothetical protein EAF02_006037 [Botrytis sinoallii]